MAENTLTTDQVLAALNGSPLLDADDVRLLTASANADPAEGPEWLPYYKLAGGLAFMAIGQLKAVAVTAINQASSFIDRHATERNRKLLGEAMRLVALSNRISGLGPNPTPEAVQRVDAACRELLLEAK